MFKKQKITLVLSFFFILLILPSAIVKADTIQDLQFGVSVQGSITADINTNKYKIVLPSAGKINLSIMSQIYDVYADIEDTQGNSIVNGDIYYGNDQSPKEWNTSVDLEAGTYYIKVSKYSSYLGKYNLLVNFTPANNDDVEQNNGILTAQPISLNAAQITGYLTWNDNTDVYKVVVPKAGKVNINIISSIYDVYTSLEDSKGNSIYNKEIYYGSDDSPKEFVISEDLEAGTYYLKVYKYNSYTGKYKVAVNYTSANNNDVEPNNGTVTAQQIGLNGNQLTGYISWSDDTDVYKVVVPKAGKVNINIISSIYDVYTSLEDSKGNSIYNKEIYYGSDDSPKEFVISEDLEAGTYYLKVYKYNSYTGKYKVAVNYTSANNNDVEPNNGTLTAQLLALNEDPITGYLSWSDSEDFYKITIPKDDDAYIYINSYLQEMEFELFDSNINRIDYEDIYYGSDENPKSYSNKLNLAAGTYYLKISKYSSYTGKYTLKVDCKSAELTADQLYTNAFNATMSAVNLKTQMAINQARKAIEKLRGTGAEWAIGEFSKNVDQIQQPFLVNICNAISAAVANPTQANINVAKVAIDPDLPVEWRSSYSSAVDTIQQGLMKRVIAAVEKAVATKDKADIDAANKLIEDVKTATDPAIAAWAVEMQKQLQN